MLVRLKPLDDRIVRLTEDILDPGTLCMVTMCIGTSMPRSLCAGEIRVITIICLPCLENTFMAFVIITTSYHNLIITLGAFEKRFRTDGTFELLEATFRIYTLTSSLTAYRAYYWNHHVLPELTPHGTSENWRSWVLLLNIGK